MKLANHFKMGRYIYRTMDENGMTLRRTSFLLGAVAPDFFLSFLWRPHEREHSSKYFRKLLRRLRTSTQSCERSSFSFYLGVTTHYISDFLCYAHTPAFRGHMREHIRYENEQTVNDNDILPFLKKKILTHTIDEMIDLLDGYILSRERLLEENAEMCYADIPVAMYVATWAASCVYLCTKHASHETCADSVLATEYL